MENNDISKIFMIKDFLSSRPEALGVFGYGSGITKQSGYSDNDRPQIDLIVAVKNDKEWHKQNIDANPKDYSFTGKAFFKNAPASWYHYGSDICYITNIEHKKQSYKVGVVDKDKLINDLLHWQTFYLAGRFQKPMLNVKSDSEIDYAIRINRKNALLVSLIMLEENKHNLRDLYAKICSLSYIGDTRMGIAENPNKINNIVDGAFSILDGMYSDFGLFSKDKSSGEIFFDEAKIINKLHHTPLTIIEPENRCYYKKEELITLRHSIEKQFADKNRDASAAQTLKGLLTAGPSKSISYAYKKIAKRFPTKR